MENPSLFFHFYVFGRSVTPPTFERWPFIDVILYTPVTLWSPELYSLWVPPLCDAWILLLQATDFCGWPCPGVCQVLPCVEDLVWRQPGANGPGSGWVVKGLESWIWQVGPVHDMAGCWVWGVPKLSIIPLVSKAGSRVGWLRDPRCLRTGIG